MPLVDKDRAGYQAVGARAVVEDQELIDFVLAGRGPVADEVALDFDNVTAVFREEKMVDERNNHAELEARTKLALDLYTGASEFFVHSLGPESQTLRDVQEGKDVSDDIYKYDNRYALLSYFAYCQLGGADRIDQLRVDFNVDFDKLLNQCERASLYLKAIDKIIKYFHDHVDTSDVGAVERFMQSSLDRKHLNALLQLCQPHAEEDDAVEQKSDTTESDRLRRPAGHRGYGAAASAHRLLSDDSDAVPLTTFQRGASQDRSVVIASARSTAVALVAAPSQFQLVLFKAPPVYNYLAAQPSVKRESRRTSELMEVIRRGAATPRQLLRDLFAVYNPAAEAARQLIAGQETKIKQHVENQGKIQATREEIANNSLAAFERIAAVIKRHKTPQISESVAFARETELNYLERYFWSVVHEIMNLVGDEKLALENDFYRELNFFGERDLEAFFNAKEKYLADPSPGNKNAVLQAVVNMTAPVVLAIHDSGIVRHPNISVDGVTPLMKLIDLFIATDKAIRNTTLPEVIFNAFTRQRHELLNNITVMMRNGALPFEGLTQDNVQAKLGGPSPHGYDNFLLLRTLFHYYKQKMVGSAGIALADALMRYCNAQSKGYDPDKPQTMGTRAVYGDGARKVFQTRFADLRQYLTLLDSLARKQITEDDFVARIKINIANLYRIDTSSFVGLFSSSARYFRNFDSHLVSLLTVVVEKIESGEYRIQPKQDDLARMSAEEPPAAAAAAAAAAGQRPGRR